MARYLRIYIAVAAIALLAAAHYLLQPFSFTRHRRATASSRTQSYSSSTGVFDEEDGQLIDSSGLVVDEKGLVSYSQDNATGHPIEMLIERGRKLAEEMDSKIASVTSVKDSVMDYVTAFGMGPPRGFEAWCVASECIFPYCPPLTSLTLGMPTRKASLHRIRLLSPHSFLLPIDPCFLSFPTQPHYCVSGSKNYARLTNLSLH